MFHGLPQLQQNLHRIHLQKTKYYTFCLVFEILGTFTKNNFTVVCLNGLKFDTYQLIPKVYNFV